MAIPLTCEECQCQSDATAAGWHGYLVDADDDGELEEPLFFCPHCVERVLRVQSDGGSPER